MRYLRMIGPLYLSEYTLKVCFTLIIYLNTQMENERFWVNVFTYVYRISIDSLLTINPPDTWSNQAFSSYCWDKWHSQSYITQTCDYAPDQAY